ncbi:MAG: hypothetical protein IPM03_14020 [Sulfuritalea sp.]|nr:hypothetical protein [Sulfuritalea sp.]
MKSYAKRYPLAGRRWRQGDGWSVLLLAIVGSVAASAFGACPPTVADGANLVRDGLQLAWRPVIGGSPIAATAIPMARHFAIEVQVCSGATPSGATLAGLDATMPEHRHGMNYRPRIVALGDGRFRAEGMMFHMSGRWQLEFEVQSAKGSSRLFDDVRVR